MMNMENSALGKKTEDREPQEKTSKKLDFLLDSIETEVADLAETVVTQGPILNEETSDDEGSAAGLIHEATVMEDLDPDMDLFADSVEPPTEAESADRETTAAFDALSSAEGEVESMLASEKVVRDNEDIALVPPGQDASDQDAAKALAELLTTREVDASALLEKAKEEDKAVTDPPAVADEPSEDLLANLGMESEPGKDNEGTAEHYAIDDELSEDLLANLGMESEPGKDDKGTAEHHAIDDELSVDLPADLVMTFDSEVDAPRTSYSSPPEDKSREEPLSSEEKSSDDLLGEAAGGSAREGEEVMAAKVSTAPPSSDSELAKLISTKIEALVIRLVEERLPGISERIISEKLNKIIASMK
jgi:hypothetical protein